MVLYISQILPYPLLLETLQIGSIRELEDLIIDGIYMDILRGKLDQKSQQFEVEYAIGRDLTQSGVESLLESMQQWYGFISCMMSGYL